MIGMGMIEADDIFSALAALALDADQFLGIDVIAVMGRVVARVAARGGADDGFCAIVFKAAKQDAAALVGIGLFSVMTNLRVDRLGDFQHCVEVRSQIAEVKPVIQLPGCAIGFYFFNLTSDF
jgi:hypothetical protein